MEDKARFIISRDGWKLTDTQGIVVYEMGAANSQDDESRRYRRLRENGFDECRECGQIIKAPLEWCVEDRPYGFWSWLWNYTWIRTVRELVRAD